MLLPSVAPMNDSNMDNVGRMMRDVRNNLSNLGNGQAGEVLENYQRWASQSAQMLGYSFDQTDIDTLIMTRRHWWLMETIHAGNGPTIFDTFRAEQTDRLRVFDAVIQQFDALQRLATSIPTKVAVPDTNIYMHQETYFDEIDWPAALGTADARILVPIAVVRELDGLKHSAKNASVSETNKETLRTRARVSGRKLRELLADPKSVAKLPSGVTVELLLDPFEHRPTPDTDSEIIARTLAAKRLVAKDIAIVTDDGGMEFAAKIEGLTVIRL